MAREPKHFHNFHNNVTCGMLQNGEHGGFLLLRVDLIIPADGLGAFAVAGDTGNDLAVDTLLEHAADAGAAGDVAAGQLVDGDGGELAGDAVLQLDVAGDTTLFEDPLDYKIIIGE